MMTTGECCEKSFGICHTGHQCHIVHTPTNKSSSWWKNRTILERSLLIVMMIIAFAFSMAVVFVTRKELNVVTDVLGKTCNNSTSTIILKGNAYQEKSPISEDGKADTSQIASDLLKDMDLKANPCEDFVQFTCGGFKKRVTTNSNGHIDNFMIVESALQSQMRRILGQKSKPNEPRTIKLVKDFYKSCLNYDPSTTEIALILKDIITFLGGWPLANPHWNGENFHWATFAAKARKIGYWSNALIKLSIQYDVLNTKIRRIFLFPGTLGLEKEFLLRGMNHPHVQTYFQNMITIPTVLGIDKKRVVEEQQEVLMFELKLAQLVAAESSPEISIATLRKYNYNIPDIPWSDYINSYLAPYASVPGDEIVYVQQMKYMGRLAALLKQTPVKVVANYCVWRLINHFLPQLDKDLARIKPPLTTREFTCSREATKHFPMGVGACYVRSHFDNSVKNTTMEMVNTIRAEFVHILKNIDWMDPVTKKHALEKAAAMTSHIAYPRELLDNRKIDEYTSDLHTNAGNYFLNIINLTRFKLDNEAKSLTSPANKSAWFDHSEIATINAFYIPLQNALEFPAGILQGSFYNKNRPNYMNYGTIGFIIGHEITHGFDVNGRQFDKHGNFANWWGRQAERQFNEKASCIVNQYSNYQSKEARVNLDGKRTLGENIADIGSTKIVYNAYRSYLNKHGEEPPLPGMHFTNLQMFWINMGRIWCSKSSPQDLKNTILTSLHSPSDFRIIGSVSNSPEFARDFNCPEGSKMNPPRKCSIW